MLTVHSTENAYMVAVLRLCHVVTPLFLLEKRAGAQNVLQVIGGNSGRMVGDLPKVQVVIFFISFKYNYSM